MVLFSRPAPCKPQCSVRFCGSRSLGALTSQDCPCSSLGICECGEKDGLSLSLQAAMEL